MYNDFVIVGPSSDPAGIANSGSAAGAFAMIAEAEHEFVSQRRPERHEQEGIGNLARPRA